MAIIDIRKQMTEGLNKNLSENFAKSMVKKASDDSIVVKKAEKNSRDSILDFTDAINNLVESANQAEEVKDFKFAYVIDYFIKKAFVEYNYKTNLIKTAAIDGEDEGGIPEVEMPEDVKKTLGNFEMVDDVIVILRKIAKDKLFAKRIGKKAMEKVDGDMLKAVIGDKFVIKNVMIEILDKESIVLADPEIMIEQLVNQLSAGRGWEMIWAYDIMKITLNLGEETWNRLFKKAKSIKMEKQAFCIGLTKSAELFKFIGISKIASEIDSFAKLVKI